MKFQLSDSGNPFSATGLLPGWSLKLGCARQIAVYYTSSWTGKKEVFQI